MLYLKYIKEFNNYTNIDNTINKINKFANSNDVSVNIVEHNDDTLLLDTIDSNVKGAGSKFMKFLCDICDENNLNITLIPAGSSKRSRKWLIEWYKSFGFIITDDPKYKYMVRFPNVKIDEFYYFKNKNAYIPDSIKKVFTDIGIWNKSIEKCILAIGEFAYDLATNKGAMVDKIYYKNRSVISELINRYYYNGLPKVVDEDVFNKLAKNNTIYYRGVENKKYVDDIKYRNIFSGINNFIQGTWITTNKAYAYTYANNEDDNLIECLISKDSKIYDEGKSELKYDVDKIHSDLNEVLSDMEYTNLEYKYILFMLKYMRDYLLFNKNFMLAINGYDIYNHTNNVMIVLNKSKLIIKK